MTTHRLKTWPDMFKVLLNGDKTAEVRKDDRGFKVGDYLELAEYNPRIKAFSGNIFYAQITHILACPLWGISEGYVLLSFVPVKACLYCGQFNIGSGICIPGCPTRKG